MLVGRSHECDHPPEVAARPVLTCQTTHDGSPAEIDAQVSSSLSSGASLYALDERTLGDLSPDLILTQDLCEVCSIDLGTVRRIADRIEPRPAIVSLNPHTVEDILDDIVRVGAAAGLVENAMIAVTNLRERLFHASEHVNPYEDGPSVGFLEWTDPIFCAGHWNVQLIERAGGRHPLNPTIARPGSGAAAGPQHAQRIAGKSRRIPIDEFLASSPEAIIISPCGFDLDRARRAAHDLSRLPWWRGLPAVKNNRVAIVDGNQMFNRPGPRVVDAFEWLVGWLQNRPELIPRGFPWEEFRP